MERHYYSVPYVLGKATTLTQHLFPSANKVAAETLIRNAVHEDGGPLIHNGWEDEQRSFDSTYRKF